MHRIAIGVALLALAAVAAPPAAAAPSFDDPPGDFGLGGNTEINFSFNKRAVAAGDLTGDGRPEVAMVGGGVGLLELTGSAASFAAPIGFGDSDYFSDQIITVFNDVAIAELGGDARPDIVAVGDEGALTFIQQPTGGPQGFEPTSYLLLTNPLNAIAVGDLDGGPLDLIVVGPRGGWVIRQTGAGLFDTPLPFLPGTNLHDVALGDVNRDGRADIVVAGAGGARVLLRSATGFSFTANPSTFAPGPIVSLVAGYFDTGETLDVAASRPAGDQVLIRLGKGDAGGTFDAVVPVGVSENPGALATGDLDVNGTADLIVARRDRAASDETELHDRASVLSGAGNGTFSAAATVDVYKADDAADFSNDVRGIAVADIDLDERPDLLFADESLSAAIVARNTSIVVPRPGPSGPGGSAGAGGGSGTGGGTGGTSAQGAGPGLSISSARRQKLSVTTGIAVSASCAAACKLTASGKISLRPRAKKKIALGPITRSLRAGEPTRITLRIPRRRWPAIGRAQARGVPVRATIVITAEDAGGTRQIETIVFRLVPRRPGRG